MYKPAILVKIYKEEFQFLMELEQMLFFLGGKLPAEKETGPSAEMMERLCSDTDCPINLDQVILPKLSDDKVNKALIVISVYYWEMSCCM